MDTRGSHCFLCCVRLCKQRGLICSGSAQSEIALLVKIFFIDSAPAQTFPPQLVQEAPILRDLGGIWTHGVARTEGGIPVISASQLS